MLVIIIALEFNGYCMQVPERPSYALMKIIIADQYRLANRMKIPERLNLTAIKIVIADQYRLTNRTKVPERTKTTLFSINIKLRLGALYQRGQLG